MLDERPMPDPMPSSSGPFVDFSKFILSADAGKLLDLEYCIQRNVAVLDVPAAPADPIKVGMLEPKDQDLKRDLEGRLKRTVEPVQLNAFEIRQALAKIYCVGIDRAENLVGPLDAARKIRFEADQPISEMVNDMLSTAIRRRASDIHIEVFREDIDLRFRVDGVLLQVPTPFSPENVLKVISRMKVMAGLDIAEKRRAQDGRFSTVYADDGKLRKVDFRLSVVPGLYGEEAVLRVLDPERFAVRLDELGMPSEVLDRYRKLYHFPHGILLVTGPTGCGKTTTLYCTIRELEGKQDRIMTVEDPVEYEFSKVSQKPVTDHMGFADYLRAFLRLDPDILLVGEIRDVETAEAAIRAATTGHLLLSTLHTKDSLSAIARLRVLNVSDDYISSTLIGVLAQRLVRRLCPDCRSEKRPSADLLAAYYKTSPGHPFRSANGCPKCRQTGYRGMAGVYELFVPDAEIASMIAGGANTDAITAAARAKGFRPLVEDALAKVAAGTTSLEEVARILPPTYL